MRFSLAALCLLGFAACQEPVLHAVRPNNGPEHTLVNAAGTPLVSSWIVWDAGLPGEQILPGTFFGAELFSVPPGATLGPHPIALENANGRSPTVIYTVTEPLPFSPRIDHVTVMPGVAFQGNDVTATLLVSGANLDVGAVVEVDGQDVASAATRGLRNNYFGVQPQHLKYPIPHFLGVMAVLDAKPVDSIVSLVVRNLDGTKSAPFAYRLPKSEALLDSDGDQLLDVWELNGFDADNDAQIDVPLNLLGANPFRRDIFLEVDVMMNLKHPPPAQTWTALKTMFAAAPIVTPAPQNGINLVTDVQSIAYTQFLSVQTFENLKQNQFDNAKRGKVFYYTIFGDRDTGNRSGRSDMKELAPNSFTYAGDDFYVTIDSFMLPVQTVRGMAETVAHELGHTLGLLHGALGYSPTNQTVMSYGWQLRSGSSVMFRKAMATCWPFYYASINAQEVNGVPPAQFNTKIDYSDGMGRTLIPNNNTLDENLGVCGQPFDFNGNGVIEQNVSADINYDDPEYLEPFQDFPNWRTINFRGPQFNGDWTP